MHSARHHCASQRRAAVRVNEPVPGCAAGYRADPCSGSPARHISALTERLHSPCQPVHVRGAQAQARPDRDDSLGAWIRLLPSGAHLDGTGYPDERCVGALRASTAARFSTASRASREATLRTPCRAEHPQGGVGRRSGANPRTERLGNPVGALRLGRQSCKSVPPAGLLGLRLASGFPSGPPS